MPHLFQIKICGITSPTDAAMVCEAGAGAIGINFYPASTRFVGTNSAVGIANEVDRFNRKASTPVQKVGVFVNSTTAEIANSVLICGLNIVQLHGNEKPEDLKKLHRILTERYPDCRFIRALRTNSDTLPENEIVDIRAEIKTWIDAGVDEILLDAAAPGAFGGTGNAIDWESVAKIRVDVPIVLAGGLNPDNVAEAIRASRVGAVDVASGVESAPGFKDAAKVAAFISACGWRLRP